MSVGKSLMLGSLHVFVSSLSSSSSSSLEVVVVVVVNGEIVLFVISSLSSLSLFSLLLLSTRAFIVLNDVDGDDLITMGVLVALYIFKNKIVKKKDRNLFRGR